MSEENKNKNTSIAKSLESIADSLKTLKTLALVIFWGSLAIAVLSFMIANGIK